MTNELNSLGGMEKEAAKHEWNDLITNAYQNLPVSTGSNNSGEGSEENKNFTGNAVSNGNTGGKENGPLDTSSMTRSSVI
jgi:hypothetical protein